jgi:hypothetical protein
MNRDSLPAFLAIATSSVAGLLLLAFYPSPADAQRSPLAEGEACPSTMYTDRDELLCHCDETVGGNRVWGTDIYTDDSALCHAALHAGAIPQSGGVIHVSRAPGRSSYRGSTRNGVASDDYGEWGGSIVFDSPDALARSLGGVPLCPASYNAAPGFSGDCRCDADSSGPVWGTNPYTDDSAVCSAAIHAGVIGPGGGVVHLSPAPGQSRYAGSTRNGFTTSDYGAWPRSFRVGPATN